MKKEPPSKGKKPFPFKGKETVKEERMEAGKKPMRNGGMVKGKRGC